MVVSAEPSKRAPEDSETGNVIANLIDWGKIKWTILTKKVPDESDIEKIVSGYHLLYTRIHILVG